MSSAPFEAVRYKPFDRKLAKLPADISDRILRSIDELTKDPDPASKCPPLHGNYAKQGIRKYRPDREHRVLCIIENPKHKIHLLDLIDRSSDYLYS